MVSSTAHSLDKITKLKDRSNKEGKKKKAKRKKEQSTQELWDDNKSSNIHVLGNSEERDDGTEEIFEEIKAKNFLKIVKDINHRQKNLRAAQAALIFFFYILRQSEEEKKQKIKNPTTHITYRGTKKSLSILLNRNYASQKKVQ